MSSALAATPGTYPIDDSGSLLHPPLVEMKWQQLVPGRGADHRVQGRWRVALRLDLRAWVGKPVRLYMALGATPGSTIEARWSGQGRLLPGQVLSGNRSIIFEGVVPSAILEESLDFVGITDGRTLAQVQQLHFTFEAEPR